MSNITRFDAFAVEPFEDFFRGALRPLRWNGEMASPGIKIDVQENSKDYVIKADLPGVKKEDINVRIDGDTVSISAEVKREKDVKDNGNLIRSERYYGNVQRMFSLACEIDDSKAEARYADGVLQLTLPKKSGGGATKKITVN